MLSCKAAWSWPEQRVRQRRASLFQDLPAARALAAQRCENQKQKAKDHERNDHQRNHHSNRGPAGICRALTRHRGPAYLSPLPYAILSWPSLDGETYIVQYRPTLNTNTPWVTLTNSLPADSGTNITFFVHSNIVQCPTNASSFGGGTNLDLPPEPNVAVLLQGTGDTVAPVTPLDDATILFLAQHRVYPPYI